MAEQSIANAFDGVETLTEGGTDVDEEWNADEDAAPINDGGESQASNGSALAASRAHPAHTTPTAHPRRAAGTSTAPA